MYNICYIVLYCIKLSYSAWHKKHSPVFTIGLANDCKSKVEVFEENGTAHCIGNIWNWTQVRNLPVDGVAKKRCYYNKAV